MGDKAGVAAERAGGDIWKEELVGFASGAIGGSGLALLLKILRA